MNYCVGIISYLPDGVNRQKRLKKCKELLWDIMRCFPDREIRVVAQNYEDEDCIDWVDYDRQPKLGIVGARQHLMNWFKQSEFDWMITFDDDARLEGTNVDNFLRHMRVGVWDIVMAKDHEFKLCALSKRAPMDIPNISAEKGEGFEDLAYFTKARMDGVKILQVERAAPEDLDVKEEWGQLSTYSVDNLGGMVDKTYEWIYRRI